ncbi:MAG: pullulanase-type alpha-1,6-glucosidase [Chloroflexi bacterium AL-W]|nr:pullulanase-type alpha-1,6-glucosidase [Chloroflexi bacterium AL-N1]NOK65876.1 pullulanase-type alpha-1,6-glucosidase [Chloroflexi bacterium AL-N10]NOK74183.1 pullulanase-type alpha-1,6-glucosidase [Chloroflexi bacterium AL-N5]NOK80909.1 pullulanase-type alpha-1,6-glucosidase [Chloroflexi bacterium AL-W]NOK88441.1 pullulanase-type alpha-1,6-glucosidase [Chloroflexi bacterium AL-N15]
MIDHRRYRWVSVTTVLAVLLTMLVLPNVSAVQAELPPDLSRSTVTTQNLAEDEQLVRESLQHPVQDEVFYFVLPDRFANADTSNDVGDDAGGSTNADILRHGFFPENNGYYHGGDFAGLRSQLDYLEDLGVTAIWMTPIFKNRPVQGDGTIANSSAGYHGYWITDFTQVDPHLGTNDELVELIDAAQSRGMKVFFDIITNHTADVIAYEGDEYTYRNKTDYPFRDVDGNIFDDRDFAGTDTFPELDAETSFAQIPVFRTPEDATVKQPAWLNDRTYYHNRGDSTFAGESSLYGDFFGLDDLFTGHPDVVDGMIDIYKYWISEFGIDGFRIDTVKHVNIEFWQRFGPEIMAHAEAEGKNDFFMYGEVFSGDVTELSQFSTEGRLPAVLDFAFQGNTRGFASQSAPTDNLRDFFAADDYYTDADSNAYSLPTFIGNHDMGRFGLFLNQDNPDASDAELLARSQLAHGLMFFARGMPVVYYGDEQGFTGDGGDKDARENMFPSVVDSYNDNDLIGTDATTADDNFDATHPIYQTIGELSAVFGEHTALRRGAQIHRYSTDQSGIYAFSRIERDEKVEYVVAFNNAETEQSATFATYLPNTDFTAVYPTDNATLTADANAELTVTVPALSFAVYKADSALPASDAAPAITMRAPEQDAEVTGRFEVGANLDADVFAEVTFAVRVGDAEEYTVIGTDNNAPYRVFYDASDLDTGTPLAFKAIVNDLSGNLNSTMVGAVVGENDHGGGVCPAATYAIMHYNRPDGDYDGWGLHLWGDAIDPAEATEWTDAKPFDGEDEYGVFAFIKLQDATQPVNFIIHKGDEKDTPNDRSFVPAEGPQIWLKQDDATNYTSAAEAQGFVTIRYNRPDGDYGSVEDNDYWGLHLWGDAIANGVATEWSEPRQPDGFDDYGAYFNVPIKDASQPVNFIVHTPSGDTVPDTREPGGDRSFVPGDTAGIWLQQGDEAVYTTRGAAEGLAIIHYHRPDGDYGDFESDNFADYWGLHVWSGAAEPTEWNQPIKSAGTDRFGVYFEVPLADNATTLSYILHRGDEKDLPEDQELNLETYGNEIWVIQATPSYLLPISSDCDTGGQGDLSKQRAHWVSEDTIAWPIEDGAANSYALHYDPDGALAIEDGVIAGGASIELTYDAAGLSDELRERFPHLAELTALKIAAADLDKIPDILKGQIAVSATNSNDVMVDATSLQIPGVLDALYTYDGELGVIYDGGIPTIKVWAPTARSVKLHIFDDSNPDTTSTVYEMDGDAENGVWSILGDAAWDGKYYLYEVEVYVPSTGQVEQNLVTDPYAVSLSMNSTRSQIVDLNDVNLKPSGWDRVRKPVLEAPEDIVLYELHVRDFSINDETVPEEYRGTFKAFTQRSDGMRHLQSLARAGLTHIHLLPAFDIATVNEDKSTWETPDYDLLATYPPDSDEQQRATEEVRNRDGFNWGYDPFHFTTPEGSYSTNPDGPTRIVEFREMVSSLNRTGLRVVMDVVYNHTNASGQGDNSVFDKVVPGYYHRLDQEGNVAKSTCCENTATEHAMMEKLMIDSLVTWATAYKVDGFRFDLMGHHMKDDMIKVREALDALTIEEHGVDGKQIYVYGEGWNFGEVENNQRGVNATQLNMGGTGIGVFNDRLRDAVRGGGPFSGLQEQGFATGLYYDPNDTDQGTPDAQRNLLLQHMDRIKVGLTGNLSAYQLVDRHGNLVTGADIDYNGSPTGYTSDPQEDITYIAAHDNETFFDALQLKAPMDLPMADRVRMQNMGISIVMLGQGVPFFHAGQDMLRSKSLDRNSYDSGDWFNRLDFTYESNNWGVGLPPGENSPNWPVMQPILANPALQPDRADILTNATHFREMLLLRKSSPLFRLRTAEDVQQRVSFLSSGPDQTPGVIVMSLDDTVGANLDRWYSRIIVVFNASNTEQQFTDDSLQGQRFGLHPLQRRSADQTVRTATFDRTSGTFTVPARTTAVFAAR